MSLVIPENYIEISLLEINQKNRIFYVGKMLFSDFENSYTKSPAEYRRKTYEILGETDESFEDLLTGLEEHLKKERSSLKSGFQRDLDGTRLAEIRDYLSQDDFNIIPNTIVLGVETVSVDTEEDLKNTLLDPENKQSVLFTNKLYILKNTKPFLIIDGQHRVEGCKLLPSEIKKNLELIFTIIVNVAPHIQAELFTTINYKVKPVPKSYLYQILGEFKLGTNEYVFLHEIVKLLNEFPNSPLNNKVKMLGKKPSGSNAVLSQAFLVESLYFLINPKYKPIKAIQDRNKILKIPVFRFHFNKKEIRRTIPKFLLMYFLAIKHILKDVGIKWEEHNQHILLKTVGMGALITLIPNFYICLLFKKNSLQKQDCITEFITIDDFIQILRPITTLNLRNEPENEFSKGSSQGLVRKFALVMLQSIIEPLPDFSHQFIEEYIIWFNQHCLEKQ